MVKKKKTTQKKKMCTCKPGLGLWGVILLALGIFFLVSGLVSQMSVGEFWNWWAILYYILGIILFNMGKMFKNQACEVHKNK